MRRRVLLLVATSVVAGLAAAPAMATHSCAEPIRRVCALTCRPVEIWC